MFMTSQKGRRRETKKKVLKRTKINQSKRIVVTYYIHLLRHNFHFFFFQYFKNSSAFVGMYVILIMEIRESFSLLKNLLQKKKLFFCFLFPFYYLSIPITKIFKKEELVCRTRGKQTLKKLNKKYDFYHYYVVLIFI